MYLYMCTSLSLYMYVYIWGLASLLWAVAFIPTPTSVRRTLSWNNWVQHKVRRTPFGSVMGMNYRGSALFLIS